MQREKGKKIRKLKREEKRKKDSYFKGKGRGRNDGRNDGRKRKNRKKGGRNSIPFAVELVGVVSFTPSSFNSFLSDSSLSLQRLMIVNGPTNTLLCF